jgi:hypothetical protein
MLSSHNITKNQFWGEFEQQPWTVISSLQVKHEYFVHFFTDFEYRQYVAFLLSAS